MSGRRLAPWLAVAALGLAACGDAGSESGSPAATTPATATAPAKRPNSVPAAPRPAGKGVRLEPVGRFDQPLYVTAPPGDRSRLFVVEQPGRIRIVRDGRVLRQPFLDLSSQVSCCGEQGLLSLAFAPDYATSRRLYVDYTDAQGDTRVVEYRAAGPDRADPSSARVVLGVDQPEPNHNGGLLLFGPDRKLYVGMGDGGGAGDRHGERGNGQRLGTLLGKLLRIDPRPSRGRSYAVPRTNPFVSRAGARPEIWGYGLRNPWRFSFDSATGDLVIGDVGQEQSEEVDFAPRSQGGGRGVNWGWRVFEGDRVFTPGQSAPGARAPVLTYSHDGGRCSITGGYVVRDRRVPGLYGRYVYGDFCDGRLMSARLLTGGARDRRSLGLTVPNLSSFGEDNRGRVYATSQSGAVYRFAAR